MGVTSTKRSVIKSIQRGTVTMDNTNSATVTISAVITSKSFVTVTGTGILNVSGAIAANRSFQINFNSSTQLLITSQLGTSTTSTGTACWQVIEYF